MVTHNKHTKTTNSTKTTTHSRNTTETTLTKAQCRTLAQIRANKSPFLTSYLYKVDATTNHTTPFCPLYRIQEHDTTHLFTCTKLFTPMTAVDLWTNPVKVIYLLDTWRDRLSAQPLGQLRLLSINMRGGVDNSKCWLVPNMLTQYKNISQPPKYRLDIQILFEYQICYGHFQDIYY